MMIRVGRLGFLSLLAVMALPLVRADAAPARARSIHYAANHGSAGRVAAKPADAIEEILEPTHAAPVGDVTRVPYGWADFCGRHPLECRVDVLDPVDIVMTPRVMRTLEAVNRQANAAIEPVSNFDHWGTILDHWDFFFYVKGYC